MSLFDPPGGDTSWGTPAESCAEGDTSLNSTNLWEEQLVESMWSAGPPRKLSGPTKSLEDRQDRHSDEKLDRIPELPLPNEVPDQYLQFSPLVIHPPEEFCRREG